MTTFGRGIVPADSATDRACPGGAMFDNQNAADLLHRSAEPPPRRRRRGGGSATFLVMASGLVVKPSLHEGKRAVDLVVVIGWVKRL